MQSNSFSVLHSSFSLATTESQPRLKKSSNCWHASSALLEDGFDLSEFKPFFKKVLHRHTFLEGKKIVSLKIYTYGMNIGKLCQGFLLKTAKENDEPVRVPPYWSRSMFHVQGVANGPSKTLGLANGKRKKLNFCRVYSFIFAVCRLP